MELWGSRFKKPMDKKALEFSSSIAFDKRLWPYDIQGSIAHAKMLGKCGIISKTEAQLIVKGLKQIAAQLKKDESAIDLSCEDIHTAIEKKLIELIGEVGGKLHTARSRNDQIALDMRMYLKDEISLIINEIDALQNCLLDLAEENIDTIMPGYTHLQHAQPVLLSHHLMAYFHQLQRDTQRLNQCYQRVDVMPLGAAALAGTSFPIDRAEVAKLLGFSKLAENSIDAVSDRDFVLEFLSTSSIIMLHLSRLCEELILWSSEEFGFIELDDAYCTGSSIMPQKRNPDIAELIRGKTGRVYGNLLSLLTVMKGLPLSYNRDMQEDKEPLFDTVDTVKASLSLTTKMLQTAKFKPQKMQKALEGDFSTSTELADYLVTRGVPFRKAHELVGKIVLYCIENQKKLHDLTLEELQRFHQAFSKEVLKLLTPQASIDAKKTFGGTAKACVLEDIKAARKLKL